MRMLVHVEGQTEETFVNEVLGPHLQNFGFTSVSARLLGNARLRRNRGGIRSWPIAKNDIVGHLKHDTNCVSSTMVDFYGLPSDGDGAWPGRSGTAHLPCHQRVQVLEQALYDDVANELGHGHNARRFVPYVMLHEFEALLFSNPLLFANAIGEPSLAPAFQHIRDGFANPEEINDSPHTAPSKRVEAQMPSYEKPLFGVIAVLDIGLAAIRDQCPHFANWISRLELLPLTVAAS